MTQVLPSSAYPLRRELRTMVYAAITDSNLVRGFLDRRTVAIENEQISGEENEAAQCRQARH
jgi:hypothetical protein